MPPSNARLMKSAGRKNLPLPTTFAVYGTSFTFLHLSCYAPCMLDLPPFKQLNNALLLVLCFGVRFVFSDDAKWLTFLFDLEFYC